MKMAFTSIAVLPVKKGFVNHSKRISKILKILNMKQKKTTIAMLTFACCY